VEPHSGGILPDYEKFHLGGINTLRGFNWRDLAPKDPSGADIGGDKFVQFNFELLIPLFEKAGLRGVVFFDTGDVYGNDEGLDFGSLRQSAGGGFRWNSPIGPIRLEYGYILDPQPTDEQQGRWEFTMGSAF
jgi:outer membrane protein insertion porin family